MTEPKVVLTGADLAIADVEAVARARRHGRARRGRPRADAGGPRRHRGARRRGRRGLRRDDRLRRPRLDLHRAGPDRAAPGEPPDEPRGRRRSGRSRARSSGRCSCCARTPSRWVTAAAGHWSWTRCSAFLAAGIHPVVPEQGSLGASGDLAPLAHLALPLIGRGHVEFGGQVMPRSCWRSARPAWSR